MTIQTTQPNPAAPRELRARLMSPPSLFPNCNLRRPNAVDLSADEAHHSRPARRRQQRLESPPGTGLPDPFARGPVDAQRAALQIFGGNRTPEPAVVRIVAVVSHREVRPVAHSLRGQPVATPERIIENRVRRACGVGIV